MANLPQIAVSKDDVFESALTPHLYAGCDYDLVWSVVAPVHFFLALGIIALVGRMPAGLYWVSPLVVTFYLSLWYLRLLAKSDPFHRLVAGRQKFYKHAYAPTGKVWTGRPVHRIPPAKRTKV